MACRGGLPFDSPIEVVMGKLAKRVVELAWHKDGGVYTDIFIFLGFERKGLRGARIEERGYDIGNV